MKISLVSGKTFQLSPKVVKPIWTERVIWSTVIMVMSGAMSLIIYSAQIHHGYNQHSLVQSSICFIGEYLNLFVFLFEIVNSKYLTAADWK